MGSSVILSELINSDATESICVPFVKSKYIYFQIKTLKNNFVFVAYLSTRHNNTYM